MTHAGAGRFYRSNIHNRPARGGASRLSIIDLTTGDQPIANEDENVSNLRQ